MNEPKRFTLHPEMMRGRPAVFILCLLLAPVGVGLVALLFWWLWNRCAALTVTEDRVILSTGVLTKKTSEVLIRDIRNVQITQDILQRLTDAGKLGVSSAGQADIEIEIDGIPHPHRVKGIIDERRGT